MLYQKSSGQLLGSVLLILLLSACSTSQIAPSPQTITTIPAPRPFPIATILVPELTKTPISPADTTATARVPTLTSEVEETKAGQTWIAIQNATYTAVVPTWVAEHQATATAKAPSVNPTGTAMAISAKATSTYVGVRVTAPPEVKWQWSGEERKWEWDIELEELTGRAITITLAFTTIFEVDGTIPSRSDSRLIVIPAKGKFTEHTGIHNRIYGDADGTCVITYEGVDEKGNKLRIEAITRLKDEQK